MYEASNDRMQGGLSRRTIVRTGVRLAYSAPLLATAITLTPTGTLSVNSKPRRGNDKGNGGAGKDRGDDDKSNNRGKRKKRGKNKHRGGHARGNGNHGRSKGNGNAGKEKGRGKGRNRDRNNPPRGNPSSGDGQPVTPEPTVSPIEPTVEPPIDDSEPNAAPPDEGVGDDAPENGAPTGSVNPPARPNGPRGRGKGRGGKNSRGRGKGNGSKGTRGRGRPANGGAGPANGAGSGTGTPDESGAGTATPAPGADPASDETSADGTGIDADQIGDGEVLTEPATTEAGAGGEGDLPSDGEATSSSDGGQPDGNLPPDGEGAAASEEDGGEAADGNGAGRPVDDILLGADTTEPETTPSAGGAIGSGRVAMCVATCRRDKPYRFAALDRKEQQAVSRRSRRCRDEDIVLGEDGFFGQADCPGGALSI